MSETVAIAGATGFVGRALWARLEGKVPLVGLSRRVPSDAPAPEHWRACTLFNLLEVERALTGVSRAFYLVHSMLPSARMAQGHFADMDLLCADNFGRAAARCGVQHIVYLGGLIPPKRHLSEHLKSRLEVEQALGGHGVPVTTLRAGMVLGAQGSSSEMLVRLVRRLPLMVAPRWVASRTQPIALTDVLTLLAYALAHPELGNQAFDVGCPDVLTYAQMLEQTAALLGRHTRVYTVPVKTMGLSLWWVSLITQTPRQLVLPLVQSLQHDMVARDGLVLQQRAGLRAQPFLAALRQALQAPPRPPRTTRRHDARAILQDRTVTSVQRLPLPRDLDAARVAALYVRWLRRFLRPLLRIEIGPRRAYHRFFVPGLRRPLLELTFAPDRSTGARQMYYVTGGLLTRLPAPPSPGTAPASPVAPGERPSGMGRFEFRSVPGRPVVLAAVHDFVPRLPWYLYVITQAQAHAWIMRSFGRFLARLDRRHALRGGAIEPP